MQDSVQQQLIDELSHLCKDLAEDHQPPGFVKTLAVNCKHMNNHGAARAMLRNAHVSNSRHGFSKNIVGKLKQAELPLHNN